MLGETLGVPSHVPRCVRDATLRWWYETDMARNWGNLSDYEFEQLTGDLLGVDLGMRFERFTRGKDGGVDLRHVPPGRKKPHIVQAKHYQGSTYSDLRTATRKEANRLAALGVSAASYRLVTSLGLTPANKRELASMLQRWVKQDDRIIGAMMSRRCWMSILRSNAGTSSCGSAPRRS
jgi:hypothetical protein